MSPWKTLMNLERRILRIIRGESRAPFLLACLAGLSLLYRLAVSLRNFAYDCGLLRSEKLSVPVISVGNVVAAGTGKTPLTHLLAKALQEGIHLGILSRGFRSHITALGRFERISAGSGPLMSSKECGDEPFLLAQKTRASIWVGADRIKSGRAAIGQGVDCLLLDDGMQHRRLKRDFEVVVVDGSNPFSKDKFLPWGMLRDSPKRLKQATLIVVTHVREQSHFERVQKEIAHYSRAPVICTYVEVLNKELFTPRKVGVFCGIGQPAHFLQTVRDLNQEIVDTLILNDHEPVHRAQLEHFAMHCLKKGARVLLCTEKDYVKLRDGQNFVRHVDIIPVEIELKITFGKEHWDRLIDNIKSVL
jgi:tetraacyldisaccharide 4'-kinase